MIEERLAAELRQLLENVDVGSSIKIEPDSDFLSALERFIPGLLSQHYSDWLSDSLDGFYLISNKKISVCSLEIYGMAIIISDQSLTPFWLSLSINDSQTSLETCTILLGDRTGGRLGSVSKKKAHLIELQNAPIEQIQWKYSINVEGFE